MALRRQSWELNGSVRRGAGKVRASVSHPERILSGSCCDASQEQEVLGDSYGRNTANNVHVFENCSKPKSP